MESAADAIPLRCWSIALSAAACDGPVESPSPSPTSAIDQQRSGMASAALSTLRYVGAVAGTAVLGLALAGGPDHLAQQHVALWLFAGAFVLSAFAGLGLAAR